MASPSWSETVLQLLLRMNSLRRGGCLPFCVGGQRVGWVRPAVAQCLSQRFHAFTLRTDPSPHLQLSDYLPSPQQRSQAVQEVMESLRHQDTYPCLREWRSEHYDVRALFSDPPLFSMERAATPLLGVPRYGVHVNGYLQKGDEIFMWVAKRSLTKPNYPGKLDHLAAGGIPAGSGVWETLLRECEEEACIPRSLAATAQPCGTVSYAYEAGEGLYLECQFVFDLEVPESFHPIVGDGEVQEFFLWPLDKVRDAIATEDFKPNCALVVLDFLLRRGHVRPDTEKSYTRFVELLHSPL